LNQYYLKKSILFFAFICIITSLFAQQKIIVGTNYVNPNEVTLVAKRGTSTTIKFDLNELNLTEVETDYGIMSKICSSNAPVILIEGMPELIYFHTAIIIPDVTATENGKGETWVSKMPLKAYAPDFSLEKVLVNGVEVTTRIASTLQDCFLLAEIWQ